MMRLVAAILLILASPPALAAEGIVDVADAGPATVCFTTGNQSAPGADCALLVSEVIGRARHVLLVQAYNFSEPRIVQAIIDAHARGVAVTVILDKTSPGQRGEGADAVQAARIPVYLDVRPRIAHNKVMIIDNATVVTGSFNFTTSAWEKNAENLLVLRSAELASAYAGNFEKRLAVSEPYRP